MQQKVLLSGFFFFLNLNIFSCELVYVLVLEIPDKRAKIVLHELAFSYLELRIAFSHVIPRLYFDF